LDIREWYQRGRAVEVGGQQTRFWHDNWLGDCPLKIKFYRLFQAGFGGSKGKSEWAVVNSV
jgi:hypothetical protein